MGESKFPTLGVLLLVALGLAARLLWRNRPSKESAAAPLDSLELADLSLTSYLTHLYRRPHQVLGLAHGPLDPEQIKHQFNRLFQVQKAEQNADAKLQILCSAFLLLMTRFQVNNSLTLNQSATNINVQVQVDDERSKHARTAACLEQRATYAEGLCANLQSQLIKSE
jgi:hypothetical protein